MSVAPSRHVAAVAPGGVAPVQEGPVVQGARGASAAPPVGPPVGTGTVDGTSHLAGVQDPCPVAAHPGTALPVLTTVAGGPPPPIPLAAAVAVPPPVFAAIMALAAPVPRVGCRKAARPLGATFVPPERVRPPPLPAQNPRPRPNGHGTQAGRAIPAAATRAGLGARQGTTRCGMEVVAARRGAPRPPVRVAPV